MGIIKTIGLAAITATIATGAVAQELKLADFQPPTHFIVDTTYTPFGEAISAATGGETTVKVFMGGELGAGPAEQYNRVVDGVADIAFGLPGYTASNFPLTLISELPGVITAEGGTQAMMDNVDMLSDEYRRVQLVGLWNNAPNLILTAKKPVRSMDDLAGLNIRVPSRNAGIVVQAWGANPVSMPAPEIYNAMQTGVIDGAMIDPTTLKSFKLAEVTNFITQGMDTTISEFFLIMNRDVFADLDDTAQQAVLDAGREAALTAGSTWLKIADGAMADFAATDGKEVITLSEDEAAKFNEASAAAVEQIVADAEAEGIPAKAWIDALAAD
ncbi:MAG: TRAP transporter substrate-binding protein [Maritimibacter sp.]|uniref:TRAP transporter substrate-binding protein n=1 Tax=Maritimibacter sp. TaxID=2003363 RepID=UPI001E187953|nr:TRAP transporter substrate-binding protein [Maritimibacter sp.]MBL6430083.1 TRAP transporter substrate-binding protein [Maritimibacter sp.]